MHVIKNTLVSRSSSAQLLWSPKCKPQTLEWHVQPLDSAATAPTAPATLQSGFDWCFQHQTLCRQTHSTQHPIKLLRNPCQMHPADSSCSIFCLIYTTAPLLFTLESPGSHWPVFAAWPAACSSTSNLQLNNSTSHFHVRTTRFLLSRVLVCNVCLPDVVFWFGAYSRNNAVTCKNRKWTRSYQLPQTCPVQSYHSATEVTQQHHSSQILRGTQVKCSLLSTTELWINNFSSIKGLFLKWFEFGCSSWENKELSCSPPAILHLGFGAHHTSLI